MTPPAEARYGPIGETDDDDSAYVKLANEPIKLHALGTTEYDTVSRGVFENEESSELYGYGIMLLSAIFFEIMGVITRAVTVYHGITATNMVFLRGISQIILGLATSASLQDPRKVFQVPRDLLPLIIVRGVFGAGSLAITYKAVSLIPIGICTSLFFTNPISTMILSTITLGENVSLREVFAALLSVVGVVLIANPTLEAPNQLSASYVLGVCLALLSACVVSVAFVSVRALGRRVHFLSNVLSFAFCCTIIGALLGGANFPGFTLGFWLALGGCFFGYLGQCCLNLGFQYCRASTGSLLRTVDVPLAYLLGLIFLHELPHSVSLLGSGLVIIGTIVVGMGAFKKPEQGFSEESTA